MINKKTLFLCVGIFLCSLSAISQKKVVNFESGMSSQISSKSQLPFWLVSNKNGVIPDRNSGIMNLTLYSDFTSEKKTLDYAFGFELAGVISNQADLILPQVYASLKWKGLLLDIGAKDAPVQFDGISSTNGNLLYSGNARSIPRIALSIPNYLPLPVIGDWVSVKGLYSEGIMNDTRFVKNTRVHYKNVLVKFGGKRAFNFVLGFHHYSQWAGTSRDPKYGKLASDFKNYIQMIQAKGGTDESNYFEWENSVGNHIGGWDFQLHYHAEKYDVELYRQTIFEDHSGIYMTRPDGITGLFVKFKDENRWISSLLYENYYTKYQSGSTPGGAAKPDGGLYTGMDNFFNNGIYRSGWTYFGRTIGSPFFLTVPESEDGITLGIANNRFIAHHFGLKGKLFHKLTYRAKCSYTQNWGTYGNPYKGGMKQQVSWITEFDIPASRIPFNISFAISGDHGDLLKHNIGLFIRIVKFGIL